MPNEKYPLLFSPIKVKKTLFRSRIMATPTSLTWADDFTGAPIDNTLFYYEDKARGGAASVTLSETTISRTDGASRGVGHYIVGDPERGEPGPQLSKITEALRRHGAVPSIQLHHAGDVTWPELIGGQDPWGPNDWTRPDGVHTRALDEENMALIASHFAEAALTAKKIGFGMIQVHGAHGWLLGQFQSRATNWRTDRFGGSLENRARFPMMVLEAIRNAVGPDFLIEYRMSGDEHLENGIVMEEAAEFAAIIQDYADIIHVSAGSYYTAREYTFPGSYQPRDTNTHLAEAVKKKVRVPVATVGAHMDARIMEEILASGKADFIAVGRGFIADPSFPRKIEQNMQQDWRPCIRCNNCLGRKYDGLNNCDINPTVGAEMWTLRTPAVETRRKVLVIGGGPAGMQAAITASERGHQVTLIEKSKELGGMLKFAYADPHKFDLSNYTSFLKSQVQKHEIDLRLQTEASVAYIENEKPYAVICAVGAEPILPNFPGFQLLPGFQATEVYLKPEKLPGERVVVVGGGLVGCEVGIFLAGLGKNVTVIEMGPAYAADANIIHNDSMHEAILEVGDALSIQTGTRCEEISAEGVHVSVNGERKLIPADCVVYALGSSPRHDLVVELQKSKGVQHFAFVGDCLKPDRIKNAIHGGYYAAMDII